ncbi:multiple RNA-binding domain-containing protein 1, partial [Phenoliferia sp. Uapishka_3]
MGDWQAKDAPRPRKRAKLSPEPESTNTSAQTTDATPTAAVPSAKSAKDEAARFAEFMSVMGPRKGRALEEASEPIMVVPAPAPAPTPAPVQKEPVKEKEKKVAEKKVQVVEVVKDGVADNEEISDAEYMTRRMKRKLEIDEEPMEEDIEKEEQGGEGKEWIQDEADGVPPTAAAPIEDDPLDPLTGDPRALLLDSPRLFVRNLGFSITEPELRSLFTPFGEIDSIHIPLDVVTKSSKGIAYISYLSPDSALAAFEELDRSSFQGRLLHILPAVSRNPAKKGEEGKSTGLRGDREREKKKEAGKAMNWGTLYMNSDAVMSSIADRLGIPKSQLLDPESDNGAVRVALAETHVIAETKQYFES